MAVGAIGVFDQAEIFHDRNDRDIEINIDLTELVHPTDLYSIREITLRCSQTKNQTWHANFYLGPEKRDLNDLTKVVGNKKFRFFDDQHVRTADDKLTINCKALLQCMNDLATTMYVGPFRNAINEGSGTYFDLSIGSSFISTWHQWKTGNSKANNLAINLVTEDIKHIFGFKQLEISASEQLKTLQISINDKPYKLPELGAGLSQFIIVLANVMIRKPTYVLIDEPELNLHPALQIDFLTSLASYSKSGVIFATHSIGLARATAERVYSFQKSTDSSVVKPFEQTHNYSEFLGEMSFSCFKDLGCEQVLLVEGVSDVRTVQQFLRKLQKDHKIVTIPLGGSQLIRVEAEAELSEITRLGAKVSVLIDKEGPDPKEISKRRQFAEMCRRLGFNVCLTERRAIENYFSDRAIKATMTANHRALSAEEPLNGCENGWSKSENWRIAREMNFSEIRDTDIGKFFSEL